MKFYSVHEFCKYLHGVELRFQNSVYQKRQFKTNNSPGVSRSSDPAGARARNLEGSAASSGCIPHKKVMRKNVDPLNWPPSATISCHLDRRERSKPAHYSDPSIRG